MRLDAKRAYQPQAGFDVREDAHDVRAALDFRVESLKHVGAFHVLVVRPRQAVEGERLTDVALGPVDELRILALSFADPGSEITMRFLSVTAVVNPAQFLQ